MLLRPAMATIDEFETLLSSGPADLIAAASLPELELFGRRTRLLLVPEPASSVVNWPALKTRARRVCTALGSLGVTPVLLTADTASPLAIALRDAGWGVFRDGADAPRSPASTLRTMPPATADPKPVAGMKLSLLCAFWYLRQRLFTAPEFGAAAGISSTAARTAIAEAAEAGWVIREAEARTHRYRLDHPQAILDSVGHAAATPPARWQHFSLRPDHLAALPQRLDGFCRTRDIAYAVTGSYAASYFLGRRGDVPELQVRLAPTPEFADLLSHLRATPAASPANLAIVISADAASWLHRRRAHSLELAGPLVVMSDLIALNSLETNVFQAWLEAGAKHPESLENHP